MPRARSPTSEWNPETRTVAVPDLFAGIATLAGAGEIASPQVAKAAFERLRHYCRDALNPARRSALVTWVDYLLAYTGTAVPAQHNGADPRFAKVIMSDVRVSGRS